MIRQRGFTPHLAWIRATPLPLKRSNPGPSGGFTLLEVLVASTILVTVSGSVLALGRLSIRSHDLAKERAQAAQLVSEGLEIIRQMRDTTFVDGAANSWDSAFPDRASGETARGLKWNPTARAWTLVSGNDTVTLDGLTFERRIFVPEAPSSLPAVTQEGTVVAEGIQVNARQVVVEVSWESLGERRTVTGRTLLTNWQVL